MDLKERGKEDVNGLKCSRRNSVARACQISNGYSGYTTGDNFLAIWEPTDPFIRTTVSPQVSSPI